MPTLTEQRRWLSHQMQSADAEGFRAVTAGALDAIVGRLDRAERVAGALDRAIAGTTDRAPPHTHVHINLPTRDAEPDDAPDGGDVEARLDLIESAITQLATQLGFVNPESEEGTEDAKKPGKPGFDPADEPMCDCEVEDESSTESELMEHDREERHANQEDGVADFPNHAGSWRASNRGAVAESPVPGAALSNGNMVEVPNVHGPRPTTADARRAVGDALVTVAREKANRGIALMQAASLRMRRAVESAHR